MHGHLNVKNKINHIRTIFHSVQMLNTNAALKQKHIGVFAAFLVQYCTVCLNTSQCCAVSQFL